MTAIKILSNTEQAAKHVMIKNDKITLNTTIYPLEGAETIILLHGGPGVPDQMDEIVSFLTGEYQIIYFEQRGTGALTSEVQSFTIEEYISDIDAITTHFELDSFHLFGHSWGGLYAQIYAQVRPQKIKSLFLCSPGSGTGDIWKLTEKEALAYNKKVASFSEWLRMGYYSLLGLLGSDKAYRRLFKMVYQKLQ